MSADTYESILGLLFMGTGNENNSWGTNANNSVFAPTARAIAGVNTITATSGTVDLSTTLPPAGLRLDIDRIQLLNGTLTADLTIKVPNVSKTWHWWNKTGGNFNVFVQVPGGVSPNGLVQIPQGCRIEVICDGNGNLIRSDDPLIGTFSISGKAAAGPGELACNGASLLRAEFPDLFNKINTTWGSVDGAHFTLPLLTDTNRFLRAGGGSGPAVGTYQSNQFGSHTHGVSGAASVSGSTDTQGSHTHSASSSDSGHSHPYTSPASGPGTGTSPNYFDSTTASNTTGAGYANISTTIFAAGAHAHNVSGTATINLTSAATGGSETRPESAAVLICIRY